MKTSPQKHPRFRECVASTLIELSIAMLIVFVAGGIVYSLLSESLNLQAKGVALNVSQQSARTAMIRVVTDVQTACAPPILVDASTKPITDNGTTNGTNEAIGPAAGISFYQLAGGPFAVVQNAQTNQKTVRISATNAASTNAFTAYAGDRLIIPSFNIDGNITAVNANGATDRTLTMSSNLTTAITLSGDTNETVVAFIARRYYYVVQNGTLVRYYTAGGTNKSVNLIQNVTTPQPFSVQTAPLLPDYNFVNISLASRAPGALTGRLRREGTRVDTRAYVQGAITTQQ